MLVVQCNKNIENYKSDIMAGFDLKESVAIIIGLVFGFFSMLILWKFTSIPEILCVYMSTPLILIPVVYSFYKPDGMNAIQYFKKKKKLKYQEFYYQSSESMMNIQMLSKAKNNKTKEDDNFDKMLKFLIVGGILFAILFVVAIVCILYFVKI